MAGDEDEAFGDSFDDESDDDPPDDEDEDSPDDDDEEADDLAPFAEELEARESVIYHPLPLNTMPTG